MFKNIVIIAILVLCWLFYTGKLEINIDNFKQSTIEKLQKEKTINAVNSSRARRQDEVNKVINEN